MTSDQPPSYDDAEFADTLTGDDGDDAREVPPQYGVGPFSLREVVLVGIWALAFLVSFFSLSYVGFASVWTSGLLWLLTIGVPTVAVFLVVLRRLSPQGIRRVGSLGIDQFASVAFSVSAVIWLQMVWDIIAVRSAGGPWVHSWVPWAELVLMLAGVVFTVFAPLIPGLKEDFAHRSKAVAHPNARPLRPVSPRPTPEPPAVLDEHEAGDDGSPGAGDPFIAGEGQTGPVAEGAAHTAVFETGEFDAFTEQDVPVDGPVSAQPFWALAPDERDVLDETGAPLFQIGPTAWALVVEERSEVFVVRHEDGRVGYLHDVSDVVRG